MCQAHEAPAQAHEAPAQAHEAPAQAPVPDDVELLALHLHHYFWTTDPWPVVREEVKERYRSAARRILQGMKERRLVI